MEKMEKEEERVMPEEDYNMWSYWEERLGIVPALEAYYPELVKDRTDLQMAITMIENGKRIISSIMEELSTE